MHVMLCFSLFVVVLCPVPNIACGVFPSSLPVYY